MTCSHVLGLIDAGPFAEYSRAHLAAARQHARGCATCGPALEAADALSTSLTALPRPAPPPDLAKAVLARIAQIEAVHSATAAAAAPGHPGPSERRVWATAVGGLATGLAFALPALSARPVDIGSPRIDGMLGGVIPLPSITAGTLVLAIGLVLYVAGLFGPLGGRSRRMARRP